MVTNLVAGKRTELKALLRAHTALPFSDAVTHLKNPTNLTTRKTGGDGTGEEPEACSLDVDVLDDNARRLIALHYSMDVLTFGFMGDDAQTR